MELDRRSFLKEEKQQNRLPACIVIGCALTLSFLVATPASGVEKEERAKALHEQARAYASSGLHAEAELLLEAYLELFPNDAEAQRELATTRFRLGKHKAAIASLRKSLRFDDSSAYAHELLATLLYLQGEKTHALFHWNKAGQPLINRVLFRNRSQLSPRLLLDLFPVNEGEVLRRDNWQGLQFVRLGVRPELEVQYELRPVGHDRWDLEIDVRRKKWSLGSWVLENAPRGVFNREINVRFGDFADHGGRIDSTLRFDPTQRQLQSSFTMPSVFSDRDVAKFGFSLSSDQWQFASIEKPFKLQSASFLLSNHTFSRRQQSLEFQSAIKTQRLVSDASSPETANFLLVGSAWRRWFDLGSCGHDRASVGVWLAHYFSFQGKNTSAITFAASHQQEMDLEGKWVRQLRFSSGALGSSMPLGDYPQFGIGRNVVIPLRAHPAEFEGRRGFGPIGRAFMAYSSQVSRQLQLRPGIVLRPFLFWDGAYVHQDLSGQSDRQWFNDLGTGVNIRLFGIPLVSMVVGYDTRGKRWNFWLGLPTTGADFETWPET